MAEYKSFHYLMHQVPDAVKPVYVSGPSPLGFTELYSPRSERAVIFKGEKSYWRTRDRVEYCAYEDRNFNVAVVTCRNLDKAEVYRTIFLSLESLCFEVESKAQGNREKLVRKKDKKLCADEVLYKAIAEFILARLNIGAEALPWPDFSLQSTCTSDTTSTDSITTDDSPWSTALLNTVPTERMCTFSKLSSDVFEIMEMDKPTKLSLEGIDNVRLRPPSWDTKTCTESAAETTDAPGIVEEASAEATTAAAPAAQCTAAAINAGTSALAAGARGRNTVVSKAGAVKPGTGAEASSSAAAGTAVINSAAAAAVAVGGKVAKPTAGRSTVLVKHNKVVPV
jgi:hypothetical protein